MALAGEAELLGDYGTEFSLRLTTQLGGHVKVNVEVNQTFAEQHIDDQIDRPTCRASTTRFSPST